MTQPLRNSVEATEQALRAALVETGQVLYERGYAVATDGNLSARLDNSRILITPSGARKGRLRPEDMLSLELASGLPTDSARQGLSPSTETPMHLEVYRQRADVGAVIHAHPPFAIALTVAKGEFPADVLPEILMTLGKVPVADFAVPSSEENARAIRPFVANQQAILLRNHGSLTLGVDLDEALIHLERIEHTAKIIVLAGLLGELNRLPAHIVERIQSSLSA